MNILAKYAVVLLLPLLGCNNSVKVFNLSDLEGDYQSESPSLSSAYKYLTYNSIIGGVSLSLKNDSTFVYETCGTILTGRCSIENDALILRSDTTIWKNKEIYESDRKENYNHGSQQVSFKVDGDLLIRDIETQDGKLKLIQLRKI